ncbi:MAG: hypothetical protein L0Y58_21685 [Verrucomicrobia subdivision 3 bacterium]|nr:hypothetical protein [Limisphaerales bacterium]
MKNTVHFPKAAQIHGLCLLATLVSQAPFTRAGVHTWSGDALFSKSWSLATNWSSGGPPSAGEAAPVVVIFPGDAGKRSTNNVPGLTVDQIIFQGADFIVGGSGGVNLTLRGGTNTIVKTTRPIAACGASRENRSVGPAFCLPRARAGRSELRFGA